MILRKQQQQQQQQATLALARTERKWRYPLVATCIVSLLLSLFVAASTVPLRLKNMNTSMSSSSLTRTPRRPIFESKFSDGGVPRPPRFAYLISGSEGDSNRIKRLLLAMYHPRNRYLLHLDRDASDSERVSLAKYIESVPVFSAAKNVFVVGNADVVVPGGPSALSSVIHGAAILLRLSHDWDWFLSLDASHYPLFRQDDLLHVFSYLPKDLNFVEHSSNMGWKEYYQVKPIILDPGLAMAEDRQLFYATQRRVQPRAFTLFSGSSFYVLSRNFLEYCIIGWENLPRKVLMYSANIIASREFYFQTVLCNSKDFKNTTVNTDLSYAIRDTSPRQQVTYLNSSHYREMTHSGAAFARSFKENDSVLDEIDAKILHRIGERVTPGGWCVGGFTVETDPCSVWGDISILRTSRRAKALEKFVLRMISDATFRWKQCKIE